MSRDEPRRQTCPVPQVNYDGRLASSYDAGRSLLPDAEAAWAYTVAPYVPPDAAVLDVGAGTGRFADLFSARFQARVVAMEPAAGMRARRRPVSATTWVGGRAEALPVREGTFDLVWLCCVIHYLDLVAAGREIARVLRPDGHVLVRSVLPDRFDELVWMRWFPTARTIDEQRMPTVERVAETWQSAGLQLQHRHGSRHLIANDLGELADRLEHRAISTLELLSDEEFSAGLKALRSDARRVPPEPVHSIVDTLVFRDEA